MRPERALLVALAFLMTTGAALADDWTAVRLRGQLVELVGKTWQPIARGASIPDGTVVRSLSNGYADFVRGTETVSVSPNTEINIADTAAAGTKPFTTVTEYFGTVAVEADVEHVQHFAVVTPYLAAVVKGTKFIVTSGQNGGGVAVTRGHVEVISQSDHSHVLISVGQAAWIAKLATGAGPIVVTGAGPSPAVTGSNGETLPPVNGAIVTQTLSTLGSAVATVSQLAGSTVETLGHVISGAAIGLGHTLGGEHGAAGGIVGTVGNAAGGVVGSVGDTVGAVRNTVGGVGNALGHTVSGVTGILGHLL